MKLFKKILSCIFIFLIGCKSDKETCDQYYISSSTLGSTTTQFYYNNLGLLKTAIDKVNGVTTGRSEFYYDGTTLDSAKSGYFKYHFYYDANHLLKAITFHDDPYIVSDSLIFEYNQLGQQVSLKKINSPDTFVSYEQDFSYPDESHVVVDFYEPYSVPPDKGYIGTFKYTLDDKKRPYPDSYYYLLMAFTNVAVLHNEVTLETYGGQGTPSSSHYQYVYNAGSYPTTDGYTTYKYTCVPITE